MVDATIPSLLQSDEYYGDCPYERPTRNLPPASFQDEHLDLVVFGQTVCDHVSSGAT